jgi:protein-S-isoprenylcysteine O-methyltransferase Ste14
MERQHGPGHDPELRRGPEPIRHVERAYRLYLLKLVFGTILLGVLLFLSAGTWRWTMGWVFMGIFALMEGVSLVVGDQELWVERDTKPRELPGVKAWDVPLVQVGFKLLPLLSWILAGLDTRFGWSPPLPPWLQWSAVLVAVVGWGLHLGAIRVNRFFALYVRIQADRNQRVIDDGPYGLVRHPGYSGWILVSLATPLILGSWWAYIPTIFILALAVLRTAKEDRTLQQELSGYGAYTRQVRYRLVPGVW